MTPAAVVLVAEFEAFEAWFEGAHGKSSMLCRTNTHPRFPMSTSEPMADA
jgi:hypothetical protein